MTGRRTEGRSHVLPQGSAAGVWGERGGLDRSIHGPLGVRLSLTSPPAGCINLHMLGRRSGMEDRMNAQSKNRHQWTHRARGYHGVNVNWQRFLPPTAI